MAYVLPQVLLRQVFATSTSATSRKQLACIMGGHATVYRYAEADEKSVILLGQYDHVGTNINGEYKTCYSWPSKPAGSVVDTTFTKMFIDNALLRYFLDVSHTMTKTATNRIRHPSIEFAANPLNPVTYPHDATLLDRGAKVGDTVIVKGKDSGNNEYELCTYIKSFIGDTVAATVGAAAKYDSNQATAGATSSSVRAADNSGNTQITALSHVSYSGYVDGNVEETYTVRVIQASSGGNLTTALFQITSASGNDDVASIAPAAAGYPTAIGARGLTATFNVDGGTDFEVNDVWTISVRESWTSPNPTSGGTYTGDTDTTYIIEVTTGGIGGGSSSLYPKITVTTSDGSDFSGPTAVPAVSTAVAVGTNGVTVSFNQAKLRKGDRYTITVTAATTGNMRTIELGHSLDSAIPLNDAATSELEVQLFIRTNIEVPIKHVVNDGDYNWSQSQTQFCTNADIYATEATWTDSGALVALPVITDNELCTAYNKLYVEVRYWLSTLTDSSWRVSSSDFATIISGPNDYTNPLKHAAHHALANSLGQSVIVIAVGDPSDSDSWSTALDKLTRVKEAYNLVPLTHDDTILSLVLAHVTAMSTEERKRFRRMWFGLQMPTEETLVSIATSSDGVVVLATTEDDPDTTGTQYTLLKITSGNADLISLGVTAGDIVRYKYATDPWGDVSYTEYVIDAVLTEDSVRLVSGTVAAESTPIKVEIVHPFDANEKATAIASEAGNFSNRRVSAVWPDQIGVSGRLVDNYFLAAARAGMASGVYPNQGMTNTEVVGFDDLSRTTKLFSESQLDVMAGGGVDITTEDDATGQVYVRHSVTTADYNDVNLREEMVTRNADSISFRFDEQFSPYIGKTNAVAGMLNIIEAETKAVIQDLRQETTPTLGGQIVDAEITDLRISPVFADHIILSLSCDLPAPFNNLELTIFIS